MSEEMNFTPELYTLVDEDGKEQEFEMLDAMEHEGQRYYALIPYHENPEETLEDDGDLVILKSEFEGDEEILVTIDDDKEYEKIGEMFLQRVQSMFEDEEDEDGCDCGHDCGCGDNCGCHHEE